MDTSPQPDPPLSLSSLKRPISPPSIRRRAAESKGHTRNSIRSQATSYSLAAVEAGDANITDHLTYFSTHLARAIRFQSSPSEARLSVPDLVALYKRHEQPNGHHFVVHQHDHPVAGLHYDLRLQFSQTSSISFAIMYGLPGNPNSRRLSRNATETRVHCLWNHLIESASPSSGSLIIWDTGSYEVLPSERRDRTTDDEASSSSSTDADEDTPPGKPQNERLIDAFKRVRHLLVPPNKPIKSIVHPLTPPHQRKIRLRLHGTRLPSGYTITMRLPAYSSTSEPPSSHATKRKRRPKIPSRDSSPRPASPTPLSPTSSPAASPTGSHNRSTSSNSSNGNSQARIHLTNAYAGAHNTIGSIHQRRWFMTLDRFASGFMRIPTPAPAPAATATAKGGRGVQWIRRQHATARDRGVQRPMNGMVGDGFDTFLVRGRDVERSVVTGRRGGDVLDDEAVEGFVPRRGWRAVLD